MVKIKKKKLKNKPYDQYQCPHCKKWNDFIEYYTIGTVLTCSNCNRTPELKKIYMRHKDIIILQDEIKK